MNKFVPYSELEFSAEFPIMPKIEYDYSKLRVKKPALKVDKAKVDEAIENLRQQMAKRVATGKPAQNGDEVKFDFEGVRKGKPVEGAAAKNHTMIIGSKTFIPGFEEELVGLKKDEEKTFDITFPKDYHASDLKNAKVEFSVKINEIRRSRAIN